MSGEKNIKNCSDHLLNIVFWMIKFHGDNKFLSEFVSQVK